MKIASLETIKREEATMRDRARGILSDLGVEYVDGEIVSVPCVLHNIENIARFVEGKPDIIGVECEMSTFYHYSVKASLEAFALLYIADNRKHDVISGSSSIWRARQKALRTITRVALDTLNASS